jgi:ribosomal protein L37AE/L43A
MTHSTIPNFTTERAVPFYCPYCGQEDLEPRAEDDSWRCRGCNRAFRLHFAAAGTFR